uniref:uncharacterized protein LOC132677522 n=1 Tax=Panthera onca TaxID=9690 RepID=UPI002952DE07
VLPTTRPTRALSLGAWGRTGVWGGVRVSEEGGASCPRVHSPSVLRKGQCPWGVASRSWPPPGLAQHKDPQEGQVWFRGSLGASPPRSRVRSRQVVGLVVTGRAGRHWAVPRRGRGAARAVSQWVPGPGWAGQSRRGGGPALGAGPGRAISSLRLGSGRGSQTDGKFWHLPGTAQLEDLTQAPIGAKCCFPLAQTTQEKDHRQPPNCRGVSPTLLGTHSAGS